jgi:hypothetical protein
MLEERRKQCYADLQHELGSREEKRDQVQAPKESPKYRSACYGLSRNFLDLASHDIANSASMSSKDRLKCNPGTTLGKPAEGTWPRM